MARKTRTSYEVKRRYDTKTYRKYCVALRIAEDEDLIRYLDQHKDYQGTTEIFRQGLELLVKKEEQR